MGGPVPYLGHPPAILGPETLHNFMSYLAKYFDYNLGGSRLQRALDVTEWGLSLCTSVIFLLDSHLARFFREEVLLEICQKRYREKQQKNICIKVNYLYLSTNWPHFYVPSSEETEAKKLPRNHGSNWSNIILRSPRLVAEEFFFQMRGC
jgi:hypothetical protein